MEINVVQAWSSVLHHPLAGVFITVLCYQVAQWIYTKSGNVSFLHPVLLGLVLVVTLLIMFKIPYATYMESAQLLNLFLSLATVALAIPLYNHFHRIRQHFLPLMLTLLTSSIFAIFSVVSIAWWLGGTEKILLSLAPKSVTTPVAIILADQIGAYASLTAVIVMITGVLGAILSPVLFKIFGVKDQAEKGLLLGITAHAVGTAKAFEIGDEAGAFSSLGLGLMCIFTAVLLPLMMPVIVVLFLS